MPTHIHFQYSSACEWKSPSSEQLCINLRNCHSGMPCNHDGWWRLCTGDTGIANHYFNKSFCNKAITPSLNCEFKKNYHKKNEMRGSDGTY